VFVVPYPTLRVALAAALSPSLSEVHFPLGFHHPSGGLVSSSQRVGSLRNAGALPLVRACENYSSAVAGLLRGWRNYGKERELTLEYPLDL